MALDLNEARLSDLIEAAKQRLLVPLVGAGLSRQADPPFPGWRDLLLKLNERARVLNQVSRDEFDELNQLLDNKQFLMAAQHLRKALPQDAYLNFLTETFNRRAAPAEVHRALIRLKPYLILTTNYDRLLQDAYVQVCREYVQSFTYLQSDTIQRSFVTRSSSTQPIIFNIHGSVTDPSTIILTERDYRKILYQHPDYRTVLSAIFITQRVLMLGFSFEDRELITLLETLRMAMGYKSTPHYIFLDAKEAGAVRQQRLRKDYGLDVIAYENESGTHDEVRQLIEYLIAKAGITQPCPGP